MISGLFHWTRKMFGCRDWPTGSTFHNLWPFTLILNRNYIHQQLDIRIVIYIPVISALWFLISYYSPTVQKVGCNIPLFLRAWMFFYCPRAGKRHTSSWTSFRYSMESTFKINQNPKKRQKRRKNQRSQKLSYNLNSNVFFVELNK